MGLEQVELVMEVEDAFGICIDDAMASELRTVGQLFDVVLGLIRSGGYTKLQARPDLEAYVWQRLCALSAALASGVKPADITQNTRFIEDLGYG